MKKRKNQKPSVDFYSIFGLNGSLEVLKARQLQIRGVDLLTGSKAASDNQVRNALNKKGINARELGKEAYLKIYKGMRTQGIVVHFTGRILQKLPGFAGTVGNICLVVADNIEDPQNLGQIIRTCECAGINGLVMPSHHGAPMTNTVLQVSQGAFINLPLYETSNIHTTLLKLKKEGFWIIGLENSIHASPWYEMDFKGKVAIVMGSEGRGIRPLVLKTCDFKATIPMKGITNSLNVSASVSAVLFERQRQLENLASESGT